MNQFNTTIISLVIAWWCFFSIDILLHIHLKTKSPGTNILVVPGKKQKEIPNLKIN